MRRIIVTEPNGAKKEFHFQGPKVVASTNPFANINIGQQSSTTEQIYNSIGEKVGTKLTCQIIFKSSIGGMIYRNDGPVIGYIEDQKIDLNKTITVNYQN